MAETHTIQPYERAGSLFRAVCSCGWKSNRCGIDSADSRMRAHLQRVVADREDERIRVPVTLCDQPGCDEPATRITTAQGRNTGWKTWYSCDAHAGVLNG